MYENLVVKIKLKNLKDVDYWKLSNGSFIVGHYNQRHNGVEYPELFRYMAIDEASVPEFLSDKDQETTTIRYDAANDVCVDEFTYVDLSTFFGRLVLVLCS